MRPRPIRRAGAALALALLALPAFGRTPAEDMAEAAARIDAAGQRLAAAGTGAGRIGALTEAISAYQSALDILRAGVSGANARERELSAALEARRSEIQHLVAALETLSRTPPPAQGMIHPDGPVAAARAASTLSRLTPALQAEAGELGREYAELEDLRRLRLEGERDLATGLTALGAARTELGAAMSAGAPPQPRETEDPAMAAILRGSDTLSTLAEKLAARGGGARPAPGAPLPQLARPVPGEIVRGFEEPDAAGVRRPGITMRAAPLSLVTAPADAIVRYVGPFLDYGYVVVVEPDDATLVVLAGLALVRVETGQAVRRGDLIGQLGGPASAGPVAPALDPGPAEAGEESGEADESASGAGESTAEEGAEEDAGPPPPAAEAAEAEGETGGTGADEMLYIEVRHGQGPVDPADMFEGENG